MEIAFLPAPQKQNQENLDVISFSTFPTPQFSSAWQIRYGLTASSDFS